MSDKKYLVAISNANNEIKGTLNGDGFDNVPFDPLTVLCDFADIAYREKVKRWTVDENTGEVSEIMVTLNRFKDNYREHPFFMNKDFQRKVRKYQGYKQYSPYHVEGKDSYDIKLEYNTFFILLDELSDTFKSGNNVTQGDFELFKSINDLKFTYEIEFYGMNPWHTEDRAELMKAAKRAEKVNPDVMDLIDMESEYIYQRVSCASITDVNNIFAEYENRNTPLRFTYTCHSLIEMVYCIWHYLIYNNYDKFIICEHCGRCFATNTLKQKYCTHNSPYERYTHLTCIDAVKTIKRKLARRKNNIDLHLQNNYSIAIFHAFLDAYEPHKAAVSACASVDNLKAMERFLCDEVKENYYKREHKNHTPHNKMTRK